MKASVLVVSVLFMVLVLLAACVPLPPPTASAPTTSGPTSAARFTDPFAYCAAVGTVDRPDARYAGPKAPDSVVTALRALLNTPSDAPMAPFVAGTFWRCADGKVKACFAGANLPCEEKAGMSQTPNQGIVDYCTANANADVVPAAAAGRATVYEWRCTDGSPQIVKQVFTADAQGFIAEIWYALPTP